MGNDEQKRLIVVLDYPTVDEAMAMARQLDPALCRVKVGKELFTIGGPAVIDQLHALGFEVFLDLKFHDIPNTVAGAIRSAASLGVWMVNVHCSGGRAMLQAARDALDCCENRPALIGVTVLTSMDGSDLYAVGVPDGPEAQVLRLASLAQACGLDGVVCSAREASMLRKELGPDFTLVTPGIRSVGSAEGDQKRVMTPSDALAAGSSYLVVGRSITHSPQPLQSLRAILADISHG